MSAKAPFLVDSHCHLNYKGLKEDIPGVVARAGEAKVDLMLSINTKISEFDEVHEIAKTFPNVFASVGIHPHEVANEPGLTLDDLLSRAEKQKVIGIGETGLDYYYEHSPREAQKAHFRTHIMAARESGLPVIIHARDADQDAGEILADEMGKGTFTGLLHCFTASAEFAEHALALGLYISFSGIVTFKSASDLQTVARSVPADRILVETDAPYLAPVPMRGRVCEPAYTRYTAEYLAELRGQSLDDFAAQTTENFFRLFSKAVSI